MKKILSLFVVVASLSCAVFAGNEDSAVFTDIKSAYSSGFYPGVIEKADSLKRKFPDSAYLPDAEILKGESEINLQRYDDAVQTLADLRPRLMQDKERFVRCAYFLGKAYFLNRSYELSLEQLYSVCKNGPDGEFYDSAVLYTASSYYLTQDYESAILPYEYVIQHGVVYEKSDYDQALIRYLICCNKTEDFEKSLDLYNQLKSDDFDDETFCSIKLYASEALENSAEEEKAYSLYSEIVQSPYKNLAVSAMKRAYNLASDKKVSKNPADIFETAADSFSSSPEMVCEFWIRLGIDEFEKKNYEKVAEYFENAENQIANGVKVYGEVLELYESKLLMEKDGDFEAADEKLSKMAENVKFSTVRNFSDSYYSTLILCKVKENKWSEIEELYDFVENPDIETTYNYFLSFYKLESYGKTIKKITEFFDQNPENKTITAENVNVYELYASALVKLNAFSQALSVYDRISDGGLLNYKTQNEYAKLLFVCKNYKKAWEISSISSSPQKNYICGLCKINLKEWQDAVNHFVLYIKSYSDSKDFENRAYFYKGYAEYNLGNTRDAYRTLINYAADAPDSQNDFKYLAYEYGARSAFQNGDYKTAAIHAEQMINLSDDETERQEAILFCADIYSTSQNYQKAVDILLPYTKEKSEFAIKCLMQIARNYEKMDKIVDSEAAYNRVIDEYAESSQAEEAMYSLGGLYYSRGNYETAEKRYNNYIYRYVDGKYADSAMFFCADSNWKSGFVEKSIMMNKNLIQEYPQSIYVYGACKNLMEAYYSIEEYSDALEISKFMMKNYSDQAISDGIGRNILELEEIVKGTDRKLAEKRSEYESLGGSETVKGRICGTELVTIYAVQENGMEEAVRLAENLLEKQTEDSEKKYAAKNADFLAGYYRKKLENKKSAELYLKAAEYYRAGSENSENDSAAALYSAVEAFKAAKLDGDAEKTSQVLSELYPSSDYAQRAKSLIR